MVKHDQAMVNMSKYTWVLSVQQALLRSSGLTALFLQSLGIPPGARACCGATRCVQRMWPARYPRSYKIIRASVFMLEGLDLLISMTGGKHSAVNAATGKVALDGEKSDVCFI